MKELLLGLAVLPLLLLGACGDDDDSGGSDSPFGDYPNCSDIWQAGETLPSDYEGCEDGDTIVASVSYICEDESELTGYEDRYWAIVGGEIFDAGEGGTSSNSDYQAAYDACNP